MELRQTPSPAEQRATSPAVDVARTRRRGGLVAEIVGGLAADIRDGHLQPGDKLPTEAEIMARFSVSRTVVREALSRLQASGLVDTRHGIGTFVLPPAEGGTFRIAAAEILKGVRGKKGVDRKALATMIRNVSQLVGDFPEIAEMDYGMTGGMVKMKLRAATAGYILRKWSVDCSSDHSLRGPEYRFWLKDHLALYGVKNAVRAPGYAAFDATRAGAECD